MKEGFLFNFKDKKDIKKYGDLFLKISLIKHNKVNKNDIDKDVLWQLLGVLDMVDRVVTVYNNDNGNINKNYVSEKLNYAKFILDDTINYFNSKDDIGDVKWTYMSI